MGGTALKPLVTRRVDAREYYQLEAEIAEILDRETISHEHISNYRTKQSFGDIDIVVCQDLTASDVDRIFSPSAIKVNGNVISFDYKNVQVDLICFDEYNQARFARDYFSYSDLGNLIGRVARRLGFKFTHVGLVYELYAPDNPTHLIEEVLVSDSFDECLALLGYSHNRYYLGFYCPEDGFEYITTSMYFEPTTYLLGNRNHTARVRDAKRPGYQAAVEYFKQKYTLTDDAPYKRFLDAEKFEFLSHVADENPGFRYRYKLALASYAAAQLDKQLFTGELYRQAFNLNGVELGNKIKQHKEWHRKNSSISRLVQDKQLTFEQMQDVVKAIDLLID